MGKKYKKRSPPCYPANYTWDPGDIRTFSKQYDFAEEYSEVDPFLDEYYDLPSDAIETTAAPVRRRCPLHEKLCKSCESSVFEIYRKCTLRNFGFQNTLEIGLTISSIREKLPPYCDSCGYFIRKASSPTSHPQIQDVRLQGMPAKLSITRYRYKCSNPRCKRSQGESRICGLQSYDGGEMTLRLTASVLTCHIHGIKRTHIAEAYDLSPSQIDRIEARVVQIIHNESCIADLNHIIKTCHRIERDRFDMFSDTDTPITLFFDQTVNASHSLVSGYPMQKLLCFSSVSDSVFPGMVVLYSSIEDYIRTGLDYYMSHHNLRGTQLMEYAAALGIIYQYYVYGDNIHVSEHQNTDIESLIQQLMSRMDGNLSLSAQLNQLLILVHESDSSSAQVLRVFLDSDLYQRIKDAMTTEPENEPVINADSTDQAHYRRDVQRILKHISLIVEKQGLESDELISRLLYFNPAVVSPKLMSLFTTDEGIRHLENNTYSEYCEPFRNGVHIYCLLHLLDSGFLLSDHRIPQCHFQKPGHAGTGPFCKAYPYNCPQWDPSQPIILEEEQ